MRLIRPKKPFMECALRICQEADLLNQQRMARLFDQRTFLKPKNTMGKRSRVSTVRYKQDGHSGSVEVFENLPFILFIQRRSCFVEEKQQTPTQDRSCQSQPLPFSTREENSISPTPVSSRSGSAVTSSSSLATARAFISSSSLLCGSPKSRLFRIESSSREIS